MIDELDDFYDIVGRELADGNVDAGLMARSLAESGGDQGKAMCLYVRYRVQAMSATAAVAAERQRAEAERRREKQEAEEMARKREALIQLIDDLDLSPLFERLTLSEPEFDCLPASDRAARLLEWDRADEIYAIAYELHYRAKNLDAAEVVYKFICARFPGAVEEGYARSQLDNIASLTEEQRSASAKKRAEEEQRSE